MIFISHSSRNNDKAIAVRDWLVEQGWGLPQIYLDLDSLHSGERWRQALNEIGANCEAVIACLSDEWLRSPECLREFNHAESGGKPIFPVIVEPITERIPSFITDLQFANIADPQLKLEGFERLRHGLLAARIGPQYFSWPPAGEPNRSVYRGLQALEEKDAAILFGRDAAIVDALDDMRRLRAGARERALVILGASGAGKSSFLRAGLIARLRRDEENFIVLPVIRPERAAISGAFGFEACLVQALDAQIEPISDAGALVRMFAQLRGPVMDRLRRMSQAAGETYAERPPTIVIPIDQAEELFDTINVEADRFLDLVAELLVADPDTIAVFTIRSDFYARLQNDERLESTPQLLFSLPPLAPGAFKEVIEGPARLAHPPLEIEQQLSRQLLADLTVSDALPLLAFTLERLKLDYGARGKLALADYRDRMGGLKGAIKAAIDAALGQQPDQETLALARRAFVPALVQVDDGGVKRRVATLAEFPSAVAPLIERLVDQRILVSDSRTLGGAEVDTIEVAHEAILRQWPALAGWIEDEQHALRGRDLLNSAAAEWRVNGEAGTWLAHRKGRLADALALVAREDFAPTITAAGKAYLDACTAAETGELESEKRQVARTRALQRGIGAALACVALLLLVGVFGAARLISGIGQRTSDALAALAEKANSEGDFDRAARYARAGFSGAESWLTGFQPSRAEAQLRNAAAHSSALAVIRGPQGAVVALAFSPDGSRLATATDDGVAQLWNSVTGAPIGPPMRHAGAVNAIAFSNDNTRLATASSDDTARLWDARTGASIGAPLQHAKDVVAIAFSGDSRRLATASSDQTARLWDAHTGASIGAPLQNDEPVVAIAFSPDGGRLATFAYVGAGRLWDANTGAPLGAPMKAVEGASAIAFSVDGARLETLAPDNTLSTFNGRSGAPIGPPIPHDGPVVNVAVFNADGSRFATASDDDTARVWDARTGQPIGAQMQLYCAASGLAFSNNGSRLATACRDSNTAQEWDAGTGAAIGPQLQHEGAVNAVAFSGDGARLATASDDKTARVWRADPLTARAIPLQVGPVVAAVAFSPDGRQVVAASSDHKVRLWDTRTGAPLRELVSQYAAGPNIVSIAYSPDGTRFATGSLDGTARLWNTHTGASIGAPMKHYDDVHAVAFSPDGARLATGSSDHTARLWDAFTGAAIGAPMQHDGHVTAVAFSPDGARVVTASADKTARLWNGRTGAPIGALMRHDGAVIAVAFSADGSRVFTIASDSAEREWDARTGLPVGPTIRLLHSAAIDAASFSPRGDLFATGADGDTAQLWDVRTGAPIGPAIQDGLNAEAGVYAVAFSPDGTRLATGDDSSSARLWRLQPQTIEPRRDLLRDVCGAALADGLSRFTPGELAAAPELDPTVDVDACHPAGFWLRIAQSLLLGRPPSP